MHTFAVGLFKQSRSVDYFLLSWMVVKLCSNKMNECVRSCRAEMRSILNTWITKKQNKFVHPIFTVIKPRPIPNCYCHAVIVFFSLFFSSVEIFYCGKFKSIIYWSVKNKNGPKRSHRPQHDEYNWLYPHPIYGMKALDEKLSSSLYINVVLLDIHR